MQGLQGTCPHSGCKNKVYFSSIASGTIECSKCRQLHEQDTLIDVKPISVVDFLQNIQTLKAEQLKESIRVRRLCHYSCKLISPLLTRYGLDKDTQKVKLLQNMGQGDTFNCSHLCNRAFMIEPENLHVPEYGRDNADEYLRETLKEINGDVNGNEERLIPIYADGDGHCLLHAISRALVGRELFWHPLLTNVKEHFMKRQTDYKALLGDFIQDSEWNDIISEADPNYIPAYGETHGLRNIHVFGLANVLHRPIILIDSLEGMKSKGDYSAVFVPALTPVDDCKGSDGKLNKPIVIAWSSKGHNHFVPLVGIKGKPVPRYPMYVLPKIWGGLSQDLLSNYIEFDENACVIGGSKTLSESYLRKLITAMDKHYQILHGVAPSIVADVYQYIYKPAGVVGMTSEEVTESAHALVKEERLYSCLSCISVIQLDLPCPSSWLEPGGKFYDLAKETHGPLKKGSQYKFNTIICSYNEARDKLSLIHDEKTLKCKQCNGSIRLLNRDGSIVYFNGDQVLTPTSSASHCKFGHKHYWDGKEYDNLPHKIQVSFEWNGRKKQDFVYWFQDESDESLNSNAFELAQKTVHKYFPGEFGSERVVQNVVEQIFRETGKRKAVLQQPMVPLQSNINLTDSKSKTLQMEELNKSEKEEVLHEKIKHGDVVKQKHLITSPDIQLKKYAETAPKYAERNEKLRSGSTAHRIRISTSDQGSEMYTLSEQTCFNDIQTFIEERFNIGKELQIIKYGYPPKALEPPDGDKCSPLQLKHGERIVVHVKKVINTKPDIPMDVDIAGTSISNNTISLDEINIKTPLFGLEKSKTDLLDISSSLFSPIEKFSIEKYNLWPFACTQRSMFQPCGLFYVLAFKDLDKVVDNKHFSLPCFPNHLFVYNKEADEIYICLGERHIPVQPLSPELTKLALQQVKQAALPKFTKQEPGSSHVKQTNEINRSQITDLPKCKQGYGVKLGKKVDTSGSIPSSTLPLLHIERTIENSRNSDMLSMENDNIFYDPGEVFSNEKSKNISFVDTTNQHNKGLQEEINSAGLQETNIFQSNENEGEIKSSSIDDNITATSVQQDIPLKICAGENFTDIKMKDGQISADSGNKQLQEVNMINDFQDQMDIPDI